MIQAVPALRFSCVWVYHTLLRIDKIAMQVAINIKDPRSTHACPHCSFLVLSEYQRYFDTSRFNFHSTLFSTGWPVSKDGTKDKDYSQQWLVMSQFMKPDLFCLFENKGLKVTDKQCGQSVCQCVIKTVYFHASLSECDFCWSLVHDACRRLLSGRNNLVLGFYEQLEQCFYWWGKWQRKRKKRRETIQQMRQRQIYSSDNNQHHSLSQRDF